MPHSEEYPSWDELKDQLLRGDNVPMLEPDIPTFMRRPYVYSKEGLEDADVAIIGAPYVQAGSDTYGGVDIQEWVDAPKRVRQQSAKYTSGNLTAFDVNVFEHLNVVDYGDAEIPPEILERRPPNVEDILEAQQAVEQKVNETLNAGTIPIVIGQNSPPSSYGVSKPILEQTDGDVGMISLDAHWDAREQDSLAMDDRVSGGGNWLKKMYDWHDNASRENLVEIGIRGFGDALEDRTLLDDANFIPMWDVRNNGIEWVCEELSSAYDGTDATYLHFDMDVIGGGGSAPGDLLGGLAEPMGMNDYEILKIAHKIGTRGFDALSFIAIMPGSQVMYRTVVYVIMYMLTGKVISKQSVGNA
jgi:agmatinase